MITEACIKRCVTPFSQVSFNVLVMGRGYQSRVTSGIMVFLMSSRKSSGDPYSRKMKAMLGDQKFEFLSTGCQTLRPQ